MRQKGCEKQKPTLCYTLMQKVLSHPPFFKWRLTCSKKGRGVTQVRQIYICLETPQTVLFPSTRRGTCARVGYGHLGIFHYYSLHWVLYTETNVGRRLRLKRPEKKNTETK